MAITKRSPNLSFGAAVIDITISGRELLPHSYYAAVVPLLREMKANGNSRREIADELNRRGLKTITGKLWNDVNIGNTWRLLRPNNPYRYRRARQKDNEPGSSDG